MIAFKFRFHGHNSLKYVYKNGKIIRSSLINLKYCENKFRKNPRYSVVISKKVLKSAVGRNRIRRRIYEIIRLENEKINNVYDVVFIVLSRDILDTPSKDLSDTIIQLYKSANIYK